MAAFKGDSIFWIETSKIVPNPYQPRREFDEARLQELADSIRMYGVLQPLTVSRNEVHDEDGAFRTEYELIAGERRLRASKLAGVEQVPVIIREGEDSEQEKLELAIIENLQREDLNAVDRALAFKQLAEVFDLSHAQVAKKVGRSREYVSNSIRLLNLPEYMLESVKTADISEGHARTLLMLNDRPEEQDTLYREILMKKLTVREVERIARKIATDKVRKQQWKGSDPELIEKEKQFTETLGTRVQLTKTDYGGKITIDYFSDEDLDLLLTTLARKRAASESPSVSAVTSAATAMNMAAAPQPDEASLQHLTNSTPLAPAASEPTEISPSPAKPAEPVVTAPTAAAVGVPNETVTPVPSEDLNAPAAPAESATPPSVATTHSPVEPETPQSSAQTDVTPQPQSEPAPETELEPTPASAPPLDNSLRAKLSQLFAESSPAPTTPAQPEAHTPPPNTDYDAPSTPPATPAAPVDPTPEAPTTQPPANTPAAEPDADKATADETPQSRRTASVDDDQDLYGIKNFSV